MRESSERAGDGLGVRGLCCERGGKRLFGPIDFHVARAGVLWVFGPNGSGKTTLLRALAGLTETAAGDVRWDGTAVSVRSAHWRMRIAYAGHRMGHKEDLSAVENLRLWCALEGSALAPAAALATLRRVGLAVRRDLPLKRLSQGQKQRLTLARLSLSRRPLWLLDEPSASLDDEARELLRTLLREHLARNGLAVVATHDDLELAAERTCILRLDALPLPAAARAPIVALPVGA
jgi:heme exporter protein A